MMSNYKASEQEQRKAEDIRRQYIPHRDNKMEQLQKVDNKVKTPGRIAACILGVIGVLVMGAGMSMIMVWDVMTTGLALSIPGMVAALLAYPLYALITNSRKKKYADEIMRLSDSLVNE
ncbi:MAG: hypothetical protein Q4D16_00570 [Eubacteriales bacterium]|nr:hypothetical protein [Eubacteriales bacterium]